MLYVVNVPRLHIMMVLLLVKLAALTAFHVSVKIFVPVVLLISFYHKIFQEILLKHFVPKHVEMGKNIILAVMMEILPMEMAAQVIVQLKVDGLAQEDRQHQKIFVAVVVFRL